MDSPNNKLIEVLKKRLSVVNRNKYFFTKDYKPLSVFKLKTSVDYRESKINNSKKVDRKYFLLEDQINLKVVPLIKKNKCVFKYENLMLMKSPEKKLKNGVSTSFALIRSKTEKKKFLFKSPFKEGKKNKNKLKIMVDFSKKIHSPKFKESNINRDILKTFINNDRNFSERNHKIYLKTYGNEKHNNIKIKLDDSVEKSKNNNLYDDSYKKENIFIRNIIKNKERNRRAKNYYNQMHVNKMNKIIEKFSFNNLD